ncbi:MAG TPA: hypothetical protein VMS96_00710 [Terriglobales bacterium]|nr:hypothetical protein [Terriglobales bacterium]
MPSSRVLTGLYYVLWLAAPLLQLGVAVVLRRRKLDKEFPFFFKYLIFQTATNLLLFVLSFNYRAYFYAYWSFQTVTTALEFAIIYEIFGQLFRPYPYLRDFARVLLRWIGSLLLLVAVLFAVSASPQETPVVVAVLWAERSIRLVQCGLLFFLLWFCSYLGITRRHYLFGVALGFGTLASADLVTIATRMVTGYIGDTAFNLILMSAADWAVAIWLFYFLSRAPASLLRQATVVSGQKWDYGVAELLYPQTEPGLLSRIDKMVENAFAQSRHEVKSPESPPALQPPTAGQ